MCYRWTWPLEYERARTVARVNVFNPATGLWGYCSGSLVSCDGLFLTNYHCIPGYGPPELAYFDFMAEAPNCTDPPESRHQGFRYYGADLMSSSQGLDYSLLQLIEYGPHVHYGSLSFSASDPEVDSQIYIPQHPCGWDKQIALWSTHPADQSKLCEVIATNISGCNVNDVVFGYYCDTDGGSSGSPVLARINHQVAGVHHCSGCPTTCNGAVEISAIRQQIEADLGHSLDPPPPGEIPWWQPQPLLIAQYPGDPVMRFQWGSTENALRYNLYRWSVRQNGQPWIYNHYADPANGVGTCDNVNRWHNAILAQESGDFYYLVTAENACAEGPIGYATNNNQRPPGQGCP